MLYLFENLIIGIENLGTSLNKQTKLKVWIDACQILYECLFVKRSFKRNDYLQTAQNCI